MNNGIIRIICCALMLTSASVFGYANPIEGGATESVTNQWNVAELWLIIGGNSGSNSMVVSSGGTVQSYIGYLGNTVTSSDNEVLVTGDGATWNNAGELSLGHLGASNTLTVADGGNVSSPNIYLGYYSDGNEINVVDDDSRLNASMLNIGHEGSGNRLLVTDGGLVESDTGNIGYWIKSDNNVATVQSNGVWNSSAEINAGEYGAGNTLVVGPGGRVESPVLNVGVQSIADNNTVTVTGDDAWLDAPELYIGGTADGAGGTGNLVEVENGGTVNTESLNIYAGNHFDLNDGGRLSVNTNFNASLAGFNFNNGGTLEVGGELTGMNATIDGRRSLVLNGNVAEWDVNQSDIRVGSNTGGNTLTITNGAQALGDSIRLGRAAQSDDNLIQVTGEGSRLTSTGTYHAMIIGENGSNNRLEVSDGASVDLLGANNRHLILGYNYDSTNNSMLVDDATVRVGAVLYVSLEGSDSSVVVTNGGAVYARDVTMAPMRNSLTVAGPGSLLQSRDRVFIGGGGSYNDVLVSDGGQISSASTMIGNGASGSYNTATVTGAGSEFITTNEFYIGRAGADNALTITDSGRVESGMGYVGYEAGAGNNSALVSGNGSVWSNSSDLVIGNEGSGNALSVENGGMVYNTDGVIGQASGGNEVTVSGSGSVWENSGDLFVGYEGSGNTLSVSNGAAVYSESGYIGLASGSDSNSVLVTGEKSRWDIASYLVVGSQGSENNLTIAAGGQVQAAAGFLGMNTDAESNSMLITGNDSSLILSSTLLFGPGSANSMVVADGGRVETTFSSVGAGSDADSNAVLVTGSGSVWSNSTDLLIGNEGSDNTLSVESGGAVYSVEGVIGARSGNNSVTISGAGSVWDNSDGLQVGYLGSSNSLSILDGGRVDSASGSVGSASAYNSVLVSGAGSTWGNSGRLSVGGVGSSGNNSVTISAGGRVESASGYVGNDLVGGNNSVLVSGNGSVWDNANELVVGHAGSDNSLVIENGGRADSESGAIGEIFGAENNRVQVSGNNTVWSNSSDLVIGSNGANNSLIIDNGGLVVNDDGYMGRDTEGDLNRVAVTGSGSEWNSRDSLYLGGYMDSAWVIGGVGNTLYVADGGLVSVGENMHNRNYSSVNLEPGGLVSVGGNYYQDATSMLRFGVETDATGAPLTALVSVDGTATFEEGAKILYASNVGELQFDTFYTNTLVAADTLIVAGTTNANSLDLAPLDASGSLVDVLFAVEDQDIVALAGRRHISETAGFSDGSMMGRLADEIDDMSLLGDPAASDMIYLLNTMSGSMQNDELTHQYTVGTPSYLHSKGITEGVREITKHSSFRPARTPQGAAGPHAASQGLRGWVKPYTGRADQGGVDTFGAYEQSIYGTLVGVDRSFGNLLAGVAGGYGRSVIRLDSGDRSEAKTGYGAGYLSLGTEDWFGDLTLALGHGTVEDASATAFNARSEYDTDTVALNVGGGMEIRGINDLLSFTPEASLLMNYYYQEGYTEEMTAGVSRKVSSYDRFSAVSRIGAAVAYEQELDNIVIKPEVRSYWLHEFNADAESADYTLENGLGGRYQFLMPATEEDIMELGTSLSFLLDDELTLGVDLDWRVGNTYEAHTVSGRMVYEF